MMQITGGTTDGTTKNYWKQQVVQVYGRLSEGFTHTYRHIYNFYKEVAKTLKKSESLCWVPVFRHTAS